MVNLHVEHPKFNPDHPEINKAWQLTPAGSTMRSLLIDIYVVSTYPSYLREHWADFDPVFLQDLTARTISIA